MTSVALLAMLDNIDHYQASLYSAISTDDSTQMSLSLFWSVTCTVALDQHKYFTSYLNLVPLFESADSSVASFVFSVNFIEQTRRSNRINYDKRRQVLVQHGH